MAASGAVLVQLVSADVANVVALKADTLSPMAMLLLGNCHVDAFARDSCINSEYVEMVNCMHDGKGEREGGGEYVSES